MYERKRKIQDIQGFMKEEREKEGKVLRVLPSGHWVPHNQGWLNFWETKLVTVRSEEESSGNGSTVNQVLVRSQRKIISKPGILILILRHLLVDIKFTNSHLPLDGYRLNLLSFGFCELLRDSTFISFLWYLMDITCWERWKVNTNQEPLITAYERGMWNRN